MRFFKTNYKKVANIFLYSFMLSVIGLGFNFAVSKRIDRDSLFIIPIIGVGFFFIFSLVAYSIFSTSNKVLGRLESMNLFDDNEYKRIFTNERQWFVLNNDRLYGNISGFPTSLFIYKNILSRTSSVFKLEVYVRKEMVNKVEEFTVDYSFFYDIPQDIRSKMRDYVKSIGNTGAQKGQFPQNVEQFFSSAKHY